VEKMFLHLRTCIKIPVLQKIPEKRTKQILFLLQKSTDESVAITGEARLKRASFVYGLMIISKRLLFQQIYMGAVGTMSMSL